MKITIHRNAKGKITKITLSIDPHTITVVLTLLLHFAGFF